MKPAVYSLFLSVFLCLIATGSQAQFAVGRDYVQLPVRQPVESGEQIEVREFFWYGCPHCYQLEPYLERWLARLPQDVRYIRTPGVARRWLPHAKAYYTFEALGITERVHKSFFDAIHKGGKKLVDEASMAQFLAQHDVDSDKFRHAFNSFGVRTQVEKAKQLNFRYRIDSVPMITIDGRYKTSASMAGGEARLMQVINYLIDRARKERKKSN